MDDDDDGSDDEKDDADGASDNEDDDDAYDPFEGSGLELGTVKPNDPDDKD